MFFRQARESGDQDRGRYAAPLARAQQVGEARYVTSHGPLPRIAIWGRGLGRTRRLAPGSPRSRLPSTRRRDSPMPQVNLAGVLRR